MFENIHKNLPGHPEWEGSFYEQLIEHGKWDMEEFWKLNLDLIEAAKTYGNLTKIDREFALAVVTLQDKVLAQIASRTYDPEYYRISTLTFGELRDLTERFRLSILAVFNGDIVPESSFDIVNPYNQSA